MPAVPIVLCHFIQGTSASMVSVSGESSGTTLLWKTRDDCTIIYYHYSKNEGVAKCFNGPYYIIHKRKISKSFLNVRVSGFYA